MKIKTKLTLGVGLLFLLIIVLTAVGTKYVNDLKKDTENILVANYNSLEYSRNMLLALERSDETSDQLFSKNLKKQLQNITEPGEREISVRLAQLHANYVVNQSKEVEAAQMRSVILELMRINMNAINTKNEIARITAEQAVFWIAITGTACFFIAFVLLINLPSNIANPIRELSDSIRHIAEKNYSKRVHFEGHGEFGQLASSFNTMAEKLQEFDNSNLAQLMLEKKRIEALIDAIQDPVIGLDEHQTIVFLNQEAAGILGVNTDIRGTSALELAKSNDLMKSLLAAENTEEHRALKIFHQGKEHYFEKERLQISITPTGEDAPVASGQVIILRNVTHYKELDSAKTNFLATVSHEFKTPISAMKMSLQLLENDRIGILNEEQKNLLHSITDDANRLLRITGELLKMTQLETGQIELSPEPSDVNEIVQGAVKATAAQAQQKEIELQVTIPEHLPQVLADADKTTWVVVNLLTNAIRHSSHKSQIRIEATQKDRQIEVAVIDSGSGIPTGHQEKIFDRYFRVPETKTEGSGLGLAISRDFMRAQGGSIRVQSTLGEGSTFTIALKTATL